MKTVLLVEDNFFMAQLMSERIAHLGFTVIHAPDEKTALVELEKEIPTILVVDLPLSGETDSSAMITKIRKAHPKDKLPILGLFNTHADKNIAKAKKAGIDTYLVKADSDVSTIIDAINNLVSGHGAEPPPDNALAPSPARGKSDPEKAQDLSLSSAAAAEHMLGIKARIDQALAGSEAEISIIKLVDDMMAYAFAARSSDIHLEPFEDKLLARMRIDGILNDIFPFSKGLHSGIITRIKVLAGMRTDEHQAAQDGRFRMTLTDPPLQFDVRVSIVPTYYGENGVLRLLAEQTTINSLENLALTDVDRKKIRNAVRTPYGMILATGPTGSGKTTTLYTILKELNTREVSVITIEDPIEYSLEGVDQIQVNNTTGLTFANGLRSILRQDPNIIMVGEIRDEETASIAVNAALTGHKLLSTIHTNDAATTLPRLLDMGVEPFLVASTINVAIGQRLVRMICSNCKTARRITEGELANLKEFIPEDILDDHRDFFMGKGCILCHNTGYLGRMGIYEILEMNDFLREAIMRRADAGEIKKIAIKNGMTTLLEDGFKKAVAGNTTIEEILRVVHE